MNCWGSPSAGMLLAAASTAPPPCRRRFTMAAPIPLLPPVTRVRLPGTSFASNGTLAGLIVCASCSKIVCDNPVAHPAMDKRASQLFDVKFVWEAKLDPAGFLKRFQLVG